MHKNRLLGLTALASVILVSVFISPRHGWLAMSAFVLIGSIWGLLFGKEIQLEYFGKKFILTGIKYRLYCATTLIMGIGIVFYFLISENRDHGF